MNKTKIIATKADWEITDMPEANAVFKLERKFTKEQLEILRCGNIPREMEDRWFWYMERNTLYAHRSWSGNCIYIVEINEETGIHRVTVNRDENQYLCTSIQEDIESLNELLDGWAGVPYYYWNEGIDETISSINNEETKEQESTVYIYQGDITEIESDCIVNAANSTLLGGGGVDGAIHRAAGPELLKECRTLNGCETGEAKITGGYNLPAKYIIHTVGPIYSGSDMDEKLLAACYTNSLNLAKVKGIQSIAFPAISTGVYGYPLREATKIAVKTAFEWLEANKDCKMSIIFCCFDSDMEKVYEEIIGNNRY